MKKDTYIADIISNNWTKKDCVEYLNHHELKELLDICILLMQSNFDDCTTVDDMKSVGADFDYIRSPSKYPEA